MKNEIRSLTGLRGIAAVVVMLYHFVLVPRHGVGPSPGPGYLMVDLFFVLSGFVMARTYGASFAPGRADRAAYLAFLQARFARIYPLYALIIVVEFALTKLHVTTSASFPVRAFLSNIVLLQNLGAGWIAPGFAEYIDPPAWSISTEVAAYLGFPVLAGLALFGPARRAVALLAACAACLLALATLPRHWLSQGSGDGALNISSGETLWPVLRCLAGFCIGLLCCSVEGRLASWRRSASVDAALIACLALLLAWPAGDFFLVCWFPLLILQICTDGSPLARLMGLALPYRLGLWSYAIYLLHWPAIDLSRTIVPWLRAHHVPHPETAALPVIGAIVIATAAALYEGFEKPARNLLRRGFARHAKQAAWEPSATQPPDLATIRAPARPSPPS